MNISDNYPKRELSSINNIQVLSDDLRFYIDQEIEESTFFSDVTLSKKYGRELLLPTMQLFDASIPLEDKKAPFKGPYLWGKLFYSSSDVVKKVIESMHYNKSMIDMDYEDYKTTIHYHVSDLEKYVGHKIPLRETQKTWLAQPSDYFISLIENYRVNEKWPYEYLAFFWDRDTNEQFMSILWNQGEVKDESEKTVIF